MNQVTKRGGVTVKGMPEERAVTLARYIVENKATVRQAAKAFDISKSTVHKDVTWRLRYMSPGLYEECRAVLNCNKSERHIRGGQATKEKYAAKRSESAPKMYKKFSTTGE